MAQLTEQELQALNQALGRVYNQEKPSSSEVGDVVNVLAQLIKKTNEKVDAGLVDISSSTQVELNKVSKRLDELQERKLEQKDLKQLKKQFNDLPDFKALVEERISKLEIPEVNEVLIAQFVVDFIEQLEGVNRIDAKAIKNLEENIDASKLDLPEIKELDASKIKGLQELLPKHPPMYGGGSGATFLESLRDIYKEGVKAAENNQVLTYDSTLKKWTAKDAQGGGGGGGSSIEGPSSGDVDGSNTTFTFTNEPVAVSVDGMLRRDTKGVTITGSGPYTVEVDPLQPPNYDVFIIYNS